MELKFPNGFLWGAASASHQVEGNNHNDWSEWERSAARIADLEKTGRIKKFGLDNYISGKAADHYYRYKEDFALAKELGFTALRISIEWSRIEPEKGKFDQREIEHYKEIIRELRRLDIEPFVTIWHWPVPLWLRNEGGWEAKDISDHFADYSKAIVSALKNEVKFWITLNEPEVYATNTYLAGVWPPQKKSLFVFIKVINNLIKTHKKAYEMIKSIDPALQVGVANNLEYIEPFDRKPNNILFSKIYDYFRNDHILNRTIKYQDFIGLNYYFHNKIKGFSRKNDNLKTSDLNWELYPQGIYNVLAKLKRYHKPIYITENGLADDTDTYREWFIKESLKAVHKAIQEGIEVKGYLHWALTDNFEWDKGFWPCFGLIEIDYKTQKRNIRSSANSYGEICKENLLSSMQADISV